MDDSLERDTHLVRKGITDISFKFLLSFYLLVEDPKGDIFEVGDGGDLLVEKYHLGNYID